MLRFLVAISSDNLFFNFVYSPLVLTSVKSVLKSVKNDFWDWLGIFECLKFLMGLKNDFRNLRPFQLSLFFCELKYVFLLNHFLLRVGIKLKPKISLRVSYPNGQHQN